MSSRDTPNVRKDVDLKADAPNGHCGLIVWVTPGLAIILTYSSKFSIDISGIGIVRKAGCSNIAIFFWSIIELNAKAHRLEKRL